jgi:hypothetical protein
VSRRAAATGILVGTEFDASGRRRPVYVSWLERDRSRRINATAARRLAAAPVEPGPGTSEADAEDRLQVNVAPSAESCRVVPARAREADPYVHAETIVAHDGTEIRIWAPRSAVEALYPRERGRR